MEVRIYSSGEIFDLSVSVSVCVCACVSVDLWQGDSVFWCVIVNFPGSCSPSWEPWWLDYFSAQNCNLCTLSWSPTRVIVLPVLYSQTEINITEAKFYSRWCLKSISYLPGLRISHPNCSSLWRTGVIILM